jgi:Cu-processing system permease protein
MIARIATIALNTYREASRARILYGLVGLALATTFYSIVVGAYTLRSAPRVIADLGAATISIYAVAVAIMLAATSLYRELEQKTVFPILTRPIRRSEYLAGKYLGTLLTLAVFIAIDAIVVLFTLAIMGGRSVSLVLGIAALSVALLVILVTRSKRIGVYVPIPWALALLVVAALLASGYPDERRVMLGYAALTFLEAAIITAIATFFASFSSPFLTAVLTLGVFVVGRQADSLTKLPERVFGQFIHSAGVALSKVVPNLHVYVPARPLVTGEVVGASLAPYLGMSALQALGWILGLLALAIVIFNRRDFL